MTSRAFILALALPAFTGMFVVAQPIAAIAGNLRGVVELFTSQGCSSCPPADAELARLIESGEVLGLSYHVDYWNYLGWADTLSNAASTERQYGYAHSLKRKNVYTPQAVVNGRDHANGADGAAVDALLSKLSAAGEGLTVGVEASLDDNGLNISIDDGQGEASIVIVYFNEATTVDIKKGENAGHKITYKHSVREVQTVGMWDGDAISLKLPPSLLSAHPGVGCAILLQVVGKDGAPGRILGAAIIEASEYG
ncbi:DUF1223 domain-containing protein [Hoeflea sp. G2-23]|uniref:DUF1223 domain-containing protein n=1 Tax=Hoeflea algicola TaxID=2983763 RepID=A0ABT3ZAZ2_9HYPH|nr:DUF1223 domain-containing protein [Hoeflea algicola]MCY0148955.1 DUF1223 domain-containing protein [Hoeflea algicola]